MILLPVVQNKNHMVVAAVFSQQAMPQNQALAPPLGLGKLAGTDVGVAPSVESADFGPQTTSGNQTCLFFSRFVQWFFRCYQCQNWKSTSFSDTESSMSCTFPENGLFKDDIHTTLYGSWGMCGCRQSWTTITWQLGLIVVVLPASTTGPMSSSLFLNTLIQLQYICDVTIWYDLQIGCSEKEEWNSTEDSPFNWQLRLTQDIQKGKLDEVCPSWKSQNAFLAVMRPALSCFPRFDLASLGCCWNESVRFLSVVAPFGSFWSYQKEVKPVPDLDVVRSERLLRGRRRASHWPSLGKAFHVPDEAGRKQNRSSCMLYHNRIQ